MSLPRLSLCTAAVLLALSNLNAQSVTTAPVGAVSISVNANSDQPLGVTLQRPTQFTGKAATVSSSQLTVTATLPTLSGASYVKFLTGSAAGQWIQISTASSSSITLVENIQSLGAAANDQFEVRPFWTLETLFPSGQGFPSTSNPDQPAARLYTYSSTSTGVNLSSAASYIYVKNLEGVPDGWYDGDYQLANSVIINPETYLVIGNYTNQSVKVVSIGDVPQVTQANTIAARTAGEQDNLVYNPFPAKITLGTSGLISSGAVRPWNLNESTPRDIVYIYPASANGFNPSAAASFFYVQGVNGVEDGWYNDDAESGNSFPIEAGVAFVVRKFGGSSTTIDWKPAVPYSL